MKKSPCKECPFRKDSLPGWLGSMSRNPQIFIDGLEYTIVPCHMKVKWDEVEKRNLIVNGKDNPCVGALQLCHNSLKFPRGAREEGTPYNILYEKSGKNEQVFQWAHDFIKHHANSKLFESK